MSMDIIQCLLTSAYLKALFWCPYYDIHIDFKHAYDIAQVFYYCENKNLSWFLSSFEIGAQKVNFDLVCLYWLKNWSVWVKSISCFENDSTSSTKLNHSQAIHLGNKSYNYRVPVE